MGDAEVGDEIGCVDLADVFQAGLRAVSKQTKAQPGDKTMMDALVPAVSAVRAAASAGKDIASALAAAGVAARSGMESTKGLTAKHGRARFLGEKTLGYPDPGAFSIVLLFEGFSAGLASERVSGS
jgi:dihydroxyacetone kinase-like protein